MILSRAVDEKMLDTLRQVEISELRRRGGEHHSQYSGPRTKSREYRQFELSIAKSHFPATHRDLQGICTLLVEGRSIVEGVRGHLACLTATRRFLKSSLFTRWGMYVWKELDHFSVDNHLVDSPCSFRGRPINESNIQVSVQSSIFGRVLKLIVSRFSGLHKRRDVEVPADEIAAVASARGGLFHARGGTSNMPRACTPFASAARTSEPSGLPAVQVLDGQLDVSKERLALHESVCRTIRSAATTADAHREF